MIYESSNAFRTIGATTFLCPIPAVLLGCANPEHGIKPNLITVAWTGVVCSKPPMISVSLRKDRFSYDIIAGTGEFTLNLISKELCPVMDFCGVKSGRDIDKFAQTGLHPVQAPGLNAAPGILEAPVFLSCKVHSITELGSHDLFLANVLEVSVGERFFTDNGSISEGKMELCGYVHGKYYALGESLGFFGYSVASQDTLERRGYKRISQSTGGKK